MMMIATDQLGSGFKTSLISFETHKIIDASNRFSLDMYFELIKENNDNVFFSPASMSSAFAMLYEGSNGNTASEIEQVFGFEPDDSKRRDGFAALQQSLNPKDKQYDLEFANAL